MNGEGTYRNERNKYIRMFLSIMYYDHDKFNTDFTGSAWSNLEFPIRTLHTIIGQYFNINFNPMWIDMAIKDFPDLFSKKIIDGAYCLILNPDAIDLFEY